MTEIQVPEEHAMAKAPVSRETTNGTKLRPIAGGGNAEPLTRAIVMIHVDQVDVGKNVRVDVQGVEDLAASVKEHGVLQPIKVRPAGDRWEVVWGQRRLLAARMAGLERIPAITTADEQSPADRSIEQLAENLLRADLNPIDRAKAMRAVVDSGVKQADLARQLGLAPSTIANDLGLLEAPAAVQKALADGKVTAAHARAIKGLPKAEQVRLVNLTVEHGKSAHELERDAKWAREEVARQERDKARLEKIAASAVAQLEKSVGKDALIVVSGAVVANAIKKAGWTNIHTGDRWAVDVVKKAGECGCATWLVDYDTYGGKGEAKLKPACADAGHREARSKASRLERDREFAEREAKQKALAATRAKDARAIQRGIRSELGTLAPSLARALLWMLADDYHAVTELQGRHGGSTTGYEPAKVWPLIQGLGDDVVLDELAIAVASQATPDTWQAENAAGARAALLELVGPEAPPTEPPAKASGRRKVPAIAYGDSVVDELNQLYRVRFVGPHAVRLALGQPDWDMAAEVALADPARLTLDKAANIWRGPVVPTAEPAAVTPA